MQIEIFTQEFQACNAQPQAQAQAHGEIDRAQRERSAAEAGQQELLRVLETCQAEQSRCEEQLQQHQRDLVRAQQELQEAQLRARAEQDSLQEQHRRELENLREVALAGIDAVNIKGIAGDSADESEDAEGQGGAAGSLRSCQSHDLAGVIDRLRLLLLRARATIDELSAELERERRRGSKGDELQLVRDELGCARARLHELVAERERVEAARERASARLQACVYVYAHARVCVVFFVELSPTGTSVASSPGVLSGKGVPYRTRIAPSSSFPSFL